MLKKILFFLLVSLLFMPVCYAETEKGESNLLGNAKAGLLIESTTGEILFEKNKDEKVAVASMTKMVAQIIILEEVETGKLKWDEKIKVSSNAAGMGGSQIYLEPGEVMTVRDLMKGITMASANDATVAMAERIEGTEQAFVERMNRKVKELGLKNTHFVNCTGLDEENHYSTAYEMGLIAKELLSHEQILEFSSVYEDYLRQDTANKFWLVNTNKLVRFYEGADGLKTGFTDNAMYCMAVTAKRDNMRIIAIVLGEPTGKTRNAETSGLLDYGFNLYKVDRVKSKGDTVTEIKIDKGTKDRVKITLDKDIIILKKKSELSKKYDIDYKIRDIKLPIKKGEVVGTLYVKEGNKIIREDQLIIEDDVERLGFFKMFLETTKDFFTGKVL